MGILRRTPEPSPRAQREHQAAETQRLHRAAKSLLDTADNAARRGDTATEQRALQAARRLSEAAGGLRT